MSWGHFLFGFSGRINRAKYWLWALLYVICAILVGIIVYAADSQAVAMGLQFAFVIVALISSLAIMTKRLHDRDKSAWWLLVFMVAPTVLLAVGVGAAFYAALTAGGDVDAVDLSDMGAVGTILSLLAAALILWGFVELACLRGSIGPNKYGPDPLEGRI